MILIVYYDTRWKRSHRTRNVPEDNNINFWWQFLSTISRFQISSTEFNPQPVNSVVETNLTSCSSSLPLFPSLSFILCPCSLTKKTLFPLMAVFFPFYPLLYLGCTFSWNPSIAFHPPLETFFLDRSLFPPGVCCSPVRSTFLPRCFIVGSLLLPSNFLRPSPRSSSSSTAM